MLRMIDRHAVHALLAAGCSTNEIALQMGVSQRTIQRITKEPPVREEDEAAFRRSRRIGRPAVPERAKLRLRELLAADPQAPPWSCPRPVDGGPLSP
jgi:IS30 family transposase